MQLNNEQTTFVENMLEAMANEPLMRKGRGAGKSTAIRALITKLERLENMGTEEFRRKMFIDE